VVQVITAYICTAISSKNVKKMVDFYHHVLGIPIVFEGYGDYDGVQLGFIKDTPVICIWDENKWVPYEGIANFEFRCDSLDQTYQELLSKGLTINPPVQTAWGGREMVLFDPEGNKIMIIE
jgi:catechol 2,3-dioxygenase-like lactoylglutathione lyase family enzyme